MLLPHLQSFAHFWKIQMGRYACHASWVPQCYGCHVKVDYGPDKKGKPKIDTDWIANGNTRTPDGQTADPHLEPMASRAPARFMKPAPIFGGKSRSSGSMAKVV